MVLPWLLFSSFLLAPAVFAGPQLQHLIKAPPFDESQEVINNLVLFGDSYTALGYDPSGPRPGPSNPIGNPKLPGNNLSGGDNWVTYLTTRHNRSITYAYDFAWNCATVDSELVPPCDNSIQSLAQQIERFKRDYWAPDVGAWTGQNTLVAIWIGINDAHRSYGREDAVGLMRRVVKRYFDLVTTLGLMGLKNIIFLGIPAIERTPQVLNKPAQAREREKVVYDEFNIALARQFEDYRYLYAGSMKMFLLDTVPVFHDITDKYYELNAPDATCIGKDRGCLWTDDFHPAPKVHTVIAEKVRGMILKDLPWFFV